MTAVLAAVLMGRGTCETCLSIDVRDWHRQDFLRNGASFTISWSIGDDLFGDARVHITSSGANIAYRVRTAEGGLAPPVEQEIPIIGTACNLGGARPWFLCVTCKRRVAKLFLAQFGGFRCRHCYRLAFESQREPLRLRGLTMARKMRARLGGDANIFASIPPRPKGMHHSTYERLAYRYRIAIARCGVG
jgi:hypothetical protein